MAGNKLSAKAARLDFSSLPGTHALPAPDGSARPKTAPGAMMAFANDARSELVRENEQLRVRADEAQALQGRLQEALGELSHWEGAKATRLIDARQVFASPLANRHEDSFEGADFKTLKLEIESAGGNVQPVKVRSAGLDGEGAARYELVFGHRRHRACLELGLPVLAVVDNLDDRALFVEMERENRARKDLSAWEQGRMYRRALDMGLFSSNRKLAEAIGVDLSALGKALVLADLPAEVVQAFPSPLDLQFRWAKPLADAWSAGAARVKARALGLAAERGQWSAKQVLAHLLAAATADAAARPADKAGVEPFHPRGARPLLWRGRTVGEMRVDGQGALHVTLAAGQLGGSDVETLVDWVTRFVGEQGLVAGNPDAAQTGRVSARSR